MTMKIMIIGVTGTVGGEVRRALLDTTSHYLVDYSRHANRLKKQDDNREDIVTGDVNDVSLLAKAMNGVDVVVASLSGDLVRMARSIVEAAKSADVKRIIFVSSMGIHNEVPAKFGGGNVSINPQLEPYRDAAQVIMDSGINHTIIRPGWFDWGDTNYQITHEGEPFGGHDVAVPAIADLIVRVIDDEVDGHNQSLGINRPE